MLKCKYNERKIKQKYTNILNKGKRKLGQIFKRHEMKMRKKYWDEQSFWEQALEMY